MTIICNRLENLLGLADHRQIRLSRFLEGWSEIMSYVGACWALKDHSGNWNNADCQAAHESKASIALLTPMG